MGPPHVFPCALDRGAMAMQLQKLAWGKVDLGLTNFADESGRVPKVNDSLLNGTPPTLAGFVQLCHLYIPCCDLPPVGRVVCIDELLLGRMRSFDGSTDPQDGLLM